MVDGHVASIWVNGKVPHGPDMGFHMAPIYWFVCLVANFFNSTRFELATSSTEEEIW
jgi:hypothetical protein